MLGRDEADWSDESRLPVSAVPEASLSGPTPPGRARVRVRIDRGG
jgi:hypothetical protein